MKSLILFTFIFIAFSIKDQEFAPIGASWYYSESNSGAAPPNSEYIHYASLKDTMINGQSVRKISRTYYRYAGFTSVLEPLFVYNSNDTAFLYNPDKNNFGKLYIFNKSKGDTLTLDVPYGDSYPNLNISTYRLVIDSISMVTYDGFSIKKYQTRGLDDFQFWSNGWYMDYVGGLDWFFPRGAIIPEAGGPLRCYSDNKFSVSFTSQACDYRLINGIEKLNYKEIQIFPNPVDDDLQISTIKPIDNYEVFDSHGIIQISGNKLPIGLAHLTSGTYFLRMLFKDKTVAYRMIIKK